VLLLFPNSRTVEEQAVIKKAKQKFTWLKGK
jgi:hypothetical protein